MIRGIHGLLYSSDPDATRAFFRDLVQLPGTDTGGGWWIFDLPEGDLGIHPVENPAEAGGHDVSFYCDDIHGTVATLKARGVRFTKEVEARGYGLVTYIAAPGGITVQLYEPRYTKRTASRRAPRSKTGARKTVSRTKTAARRAKAPARGSSSGKRKTHKSTRTPPRKR